MDNTVVPAPSTVQGRRVETPRSVAWRKFHKHPLAQKALLVLGVLYLAAAFADFIAPYPERFINPSATFQPPSRIHLWDEDGFSRPFVYAMTKQINMETLEPEWTVDRSVQYPLVLFDTREGTLEQYIPFPVNLIPTGIRQALGIRPWASRHLFGVEDASDRVKVHLWGTDDVGGDVFGKVLFGARISLTIGIVASLVAALVGLLMGGIAGYFGGWIDELILRFVEALSAIPTLFMLLTLSAIFYPLNLPSSVVFPIIVVVLSLIGWGDMARATRAQVLSLRERDFAYAARALGASHSRIILRHLLPQTLGFVFVFLSLSIPSFILTEAVLSFFGLGIQPPATSWGLMLNTAQNFAGTTALTERWWIFIPGLFIFVAVLSWNLLGDGLRDAFDPRSQQ